MPSSGSYGTRRTHHGPAGQTNSNTQTGPSKPSTEPGRSRIVLPASPTESEKHSRRRVLAYYTHAIVTFHTFGIPLSAGLTLEYYYNSLYPATPLSRLALTVGIQWVGIFALEELAGITYKWKHWRWSYFAVSVVLVLCHAVMTRGARPWGLTMGMRALTGLCLGFLRSMTLRCLASHYRNNTAEVSTQSGAAGMLGALVHSLVAWFFLRRDNYQDFTWTNLYIVIFTLVPTLGGLFPAAEDETDDAEASKPDRRVPRLRHRKSTRALQSLPGKFGTQKNHALDALGTCLLLCGFFQVFACAAVWPTFFPLLLSSRPLSEYPEHAASWLFGAFSAGVFSAAFFARPWPRRGLGFVNTFTAAAVLAGCLHIVAAWVTNFWVWGIVSVAQGLCLGPLLALHRKVFDLLCRYWTTTGLFPGGLGVVVFGGIGVVGVAVQRFGSGTGALTVSGVLLFVGGACMAVGRWLKYPARYVVI